jgi:hypothetical protein
MVQYHNGGQSEYIEDQMAVSEALGRLKDRVDILERFKKGHRLRRQCIGCVWYCREHVRPTKNCQLREKNQFGPREWIMILGVPGEVAGAPELKVGVLNATLGATVNEPLGSQRPRVLPRVMEPAYYRPPIFHLPKPKTRPGNPTDLLAV